MFVSQLHCCSCILFLKSIFSFANRLASFSFSATLWNQPTNSLLCISFAHYWIILAASLIYCFGLYMSLIIHPVYLLWHPVYLFLKVFYLCLIDTFPFTRVVSIFVHISCCYQCFTTIFKGVSWTFLWCSLKEVSSAKAVSNC